MVNQKDKFDIKTVVLGDYATGKTSLLTRLTTGKFDAYQEATIGAAFSSIIKSSKYGTPIRYMIWDTAGQERYRALTSLYFRNADIILLCFDVSSPESFRNIKGWLELIRVECKRKDSIMFLIANKNDLEWRIKKDDFINFAKQEELLYYITSALEDEGTDALMEGILNACESRWRSDMIAFSENHDSTLIISNRTDSQTEETCCNIM